MIKINKIEPPTCRLYAANGEFMGVINEYEFHDVRCQIAKEQAEGYYCIFDLPSGEVRFNLDKDGRSRDWVDGKNGTFDLINSLLMELVYYSDVSQVEL